jgi:outer membrane usher protein
MATVVVCVARMSLAQTDPGARSSASAASCRLTILAARINGMRSVGSSGEGVMALECEGGIYLPREDLTRWRLRIPADAPAVQDETGIPYIRLSGIPDLSYSIDDASQELSIAARAGSFLPTSLLHDNSMQSGALVKNTGAFLNYDLGLERSSRTAISGFAEIGAFSPWGLALASFLRPSYATAAPIRLDTTLIHDLPSRRESLRLGDSITQQGAWGRAVYFGGVQWGSDFSTQPEFVTFPSPRVRGEAVADSTAELYVNNALRWAQQVPSGPFEIRNPPLIAGPGQVTLVVRDALGREAVTTQPYFASSKLLRAGLADYSVSAGKVRLGYGAQSFSYGRSIAAASYRRGMTNFLTLEARGEAVGDLRVGGLIATVLPIRWVTASSGYVASRGAWQHGHMTLASIDFQTSRLSMGVQGQKATEGFRQLGLDRDRLPVRQLAAVYAGVSAFGRDHLSASYFRQDGQIPLRYASGSYSLNLSRRAFWHATFTRTLGAQRQTIAMTGVTFRLDDRTSVTTSASRFDRESAVQVEAQRNLPLGSGIGYHAVATGGRNARADGQLFARTGANEFELAAGRTPFGTAFRARVQGALGLLGNHVFAARRIFDGFALVKVGEYPGVQVLSDNQPIAKTDRHGIAVVPRLFSYQSNHISIDPAQLPMDVSVPDLDVNVRPGRRAGVMVELAAAADNGAVYRLVDEAGNVVPLSATVTLEGIDVAFAVGMNGVVYLSGVPARNTVLTAVWPDGRCTATVDLRRKIDSSGEKLICSSVR